MKFEVGKSYRATDGLKYDLVHILTDGHLVIVRENQLYRASGFGNFVAIDNNLVSEWREPIKVTVWANVYKNAVPAIHQTKELADRHATKDRIACIKLEGIEEV